MFTTTLILAVLSILATILIILHNRKVQKDLEVPKEIEYPPASQYVLEAQKHLKEKGITLSAYTPTKVVYMGGGQVTKTHFILQDSIYIPSIETDSIEINTLIVTNDDVADNDISAYERIEAFVEWANSNGLVVLGPTGIHFHFNNTSGHALFYPTSDWNKIGISVVERGCDTITISSH